MRPGGPTEVALALSFGGGSMPRTVKMNACRGSATCVLFALQRYNRHNAKHLPDMKIIYSLPYEKTKLLAENIKKNRACDLGPFTTHAAEKMPNKTILIPVPGHEGYATHAYTIAIALAKETNRLYPAKTVYCYNCMAGTERKSICELKRQGLPFFDVEFGFAPVEKKTPQFIKEQRAMGWEVVFVDNVIDTGTTIRALAAALGLTDAYSVIAIGDTQAWKKF